MKNRNPGIVEILDDGLQSGSVKFRCRKCGRIWWPSIKPDTGGRFYRGSWQCPYGCEVEKKMMA